MNRRTALTLLSAGLTLPLEAAPQYPAAKPLRSCRQLLRVETAGWKASAGTLTLWVRDKRDAPWRPDGPPIPVMVGRAGMRWGRGLHAVPPGGVVKKEGDLCSPAGIFSLDTAFGAMSAKQANVPRWPWQQMTPAHAGVDDPRSRFYNRVVDSTRVRKDWQSAEDMMPKSGAYRCGLVVRHNWDRKPGAGSCIFLHVRTGKATVGCTSMSEASLLRVLRWLDPAANPLLVQLPSAEWRVHGPGWGLPVLSAPGNAQRSTKDAERKR
jgi:L,D-peptidoglycan transpeptidase YkuD (ErfK/YbiS/YcfS/YnhG family)